ARSFHLKPLKNEALDILFNDIIEYHQRRPKRLLIVEDNEIDSSQMAKILENGDLVEIDIVTTGKEALERIRNNVYDCITVDYMLPDVGGMEFVTEINNINKLQMTPVIIYSAK